jgi:hypothetical protein
LVIELDLLSNVAQADEVPKMWAGGRPGCNSSKKLDKNAIMRIAKTS